MVKHTIRIGLVSLLAAAMLLSGSLAVYADGGDNADAVIDISIKGDPKVDIVARGACEVNVKREASSEANTIAMLLSRDPAHSEGGAVIDISISGDSEVQIVASGPCEVNVRVEGPARVNINAGDEVRLNIEASDESQVFVDDQSPDEPSAIYQESQDVNDHSSRLDSRLAIISGAFPVVGLLAFFLIRRKAKRAEVKCQSFENIKEKERR